ncbi:hypothetical protein BJ322DRAFT_1104022 [Thelephora terrestris]|uniref:DUF6533 domain-containing protein n=1 Tax=Thelephora terrestris TaxID=56493 RepID=A0A9P6HMI5_9AGAM|nr:hypothetical protein BJ322DRAFT_1104022 [Thelephora terrestris]
MSSYAWIGFAINAAKDYSYGVETLLFYDYLLTLQDEIQYVWKGAKSWVFFLFLINRYMPMIYTIWAFVALDYPPYTEKLKTLSCDKILIVEFTYLVLVTLLAQIFFVARLYALAGENRKVLVVFAFLAVAQLTLGVVLIVLARNAPSFLLPTGPLVVCIPDSRATFNIRVAYSCFSFAYDAVSFLTLIRFSYSTCGRSSSWPTILRTVMTDSALYFLAILGSHLVVILVIVIAPSSVKYFSSIGINPLAQIMVSRLVLSLRKSADRTIDVTDFISAQLSFGPNPELPIHMSRTESSFSPKSETSVSTDARDTMILSPLSLGHSSSSDISQ